MVKDQEYDLITQLALGVWSSGDGPTKYLAKAGFLDDDTEESKEWYSVAERYSSFIEQLADEIEDVLKKEVERRLG